MAFFIAAGVISNDVIRRETQKGVLTTFRLETGAPRGGKLWIDVECWGHLAGTIARHATKGRGVSVSGRLIQKTWRDKTTGDARHRYVITANDIDLHPRAEPATKPVPTAILTTGTVEAVYQARSAKSGVVSNLEICTRRTNTKASRLRIEVELWQANDSIHPLPSKGEKIALVGKLAFKSGSTADAKGRFYVEVRRASRSSRS